MPTYKLFTTEFTDGRPGLSDGVSLSGAGTTYSTAVKPGHAGITALQWQTTGTLSGTVTVWKSNKPAPSLAADTEWEQVSGLSPTSPAGSPISDIVEVTATNSRWLRIKYVNSSGSGTFVGYATTPNGA